VTKAGSAQLWATLHLCAAQIDARRGLLRNVRKHTRTAYSLLASDPNLSIETHLHITDFGAAMMSCDFKDALAHARRSVDLAEETGCVTLQRNCYGNLSYVLYQLGDFEGSTVAFNRSLAIFPSSGNSHAAVLETAARLKLVQGDFERCAELLEEVASTVRVPQDKTSYSYRGAVLTEARLAARLGHLDQAIARSELAMSLADAVKDEWLYTHALFARAEFMAQLGLNREALDSLSPVVGDFLNQPLDLFAHYEWIVGSAFGSELPNEASLHFRRAKRLYAGMGQLPELIELQRQWPADESTPHPPHQLGHAVLQDVAGFLLQCGRPELLCKEFVHLLDTTGAVNRASAISRGGEYDEVIASTGDASDSSGNDEQRLTVGSMEGRTFEVTFARKQGVDSTATIHALQLLLSVAQELDRSRAQRESALNLWPTAEEPLEEDGFVLVGQMHQLMTSTRRVARANVTVLITGESGTGKEVLARAVHRYSDRAAKPFVPFNCAAIPRDLVESHLFGHRRGAFTGADRDNPGIIRAARGGTIFLDEVGELSLDLQPKLLRFLESGEIAPLGEGGPSTVDVRVVAATNSKLEHAVAAGRFREDLFYRLNVIRLEIPPLRERRDEISLLVDHFLSAAAREFKKGRVRIAEETMEHLLVYRWPGNVRQLQNEIRRMAALAEPDSVIPPAFLAPEIVNRGLLAQPTIHPGEIGVPIRDKLLPTLARVEREMIKAALRDHGGRVEPAARALGISRKGLYLKRQRFGL
jgi:DNA-binding NtrC family response regulator